MSEAPKWSLYQPKSVSQNYFWLLFLIFILKLTLVAELDPKSTSRSDSRATSSPCPTCQNCSKEVSKATAILRRWCHFVKIRTMSILVLHLGPKSDPFEKRAIKRQQNGNGEFGKLTVRKRQIQKLRRARSNFDVTQYNLYESQIWLVNKVQTS